MATGGKESSRGLLDTGGRRKSLVDTLVQFYQSDLTFRGLVDFAVIGAVVMMFLHPPQGFNLPWGGGGGGQQQGSGGANGQGNGTGQAATGQGQPQGGGQISTAPGAPAVAIQFPGGYVNASLAGGFIFDVETATFATSSLADQPRLEAARAALAIGNADAAMEALRAANEKDPNVALLRGFASLMPDTADGNRLAESFWRAAVNAGQKQAAALLGRLLLQKRNGATYDPKEAQRLIEAGAAAGDRRAMRYAGIAHLSGAFGMFDPVKGADFLKKASDAGDVPAMMFYASLVDRGGATGAPNSALAEQYVRTAASAGHTAAQYALGTFLMARYRKGLAANPSEAIDWLTRAYERGHDIDALNDLGTIYSNEPKTPPWYDVPRGYAMLRNCSGFEIGVCQSNAGRGWENGMFGPANVLLARAHYGIAARLNWAGAAEDVKRLDAVLNDTQKQAARALEISIATALKPRPKTIALQLPGVASPPPPVAVAPAEVGVSTTVAGGNSAVVQTPAQSKEAQEARAQCEKWDGPPQPQLDACQLVAKNGWHDSALMHEVLANMGWAKNKLGRAKEAIADYDRAIELAPKNAVYLNNRGIVKEALKDWQGALRDYEAALAIEPKHFYAGSNRALMLSRLQRYPEAIAAATEALALRPNSLIAMRARANSYMQTGKFDLALIDYNESIRQGDGEMDSFIGRGYLHYKSGPANYDQALADFARAIQIGNAPAYLHYYRALILKERKQTDAASNAIESALKISPKYAEARLLKVRMLIESNQPAQAMPEIRSLLADEPLNAEAHYMSGRAQVNLFANALDLCEQVRAERASGKINYDHVAIGSNSMTDTRCLMQPDPSSALSSLRRALELNPKHTDANFQVARVFEYLKNWQAAIDAFTADIVNSPNNESFRRRGDAKFQTGAFKDALPDYSEAIRLRPQDKLAYFNRGLAHERLRNRQLAVQDYRQALAIDRTYQPAIEALSRLGERP